MLCEERTSGGTRLRARKLMSGRSMGRRIVDLEGSQAVDCDPQDAVFIECVSETLSLSSEGKLLITATGGFFSEGDGANAECEVRIDGEDQASSDGPGEVTDNTIGDRDGRLRQNLRDEFSFARNAYSRARMPTGGIRGCADWLPHDRCHRGLDPLTFETPAGRATARSASDPHQAARRPRPSRRAVKARRPRATAYPHATA